WTVHSEARRRPAPDLRRRRRGWGRETVANPKQTQTGPKEKPGRRATNSQARHGSWRSMTKGVSTGNAIMVSPWEYLSAPGLVGGEVVDRMLFLNSFMG